MIDRAIGNTDAATGGANTQFEDLVQQRKGKADRPTNGNDTLTGTDRSDFIRGRGGDDTIDGKGGNDFLSGGRGDDTITTGTGHDFVLGGAGNDKVFVEGSGFVDGGRGNDEVVLKGASSDYTQSSGFRGMQVYTSNTGDKVVLRNVESVGFSEPITPPPPPPPLGDGLPLAPNDAGAERLFIGPDSVRIIGPNTDFTFTNITDSRPMDGPLTARQGSGVINGVQTTAVPINDTRSVVLSIGSGFNPTGTVDVDAAFANGVTLDSQVVREGGPIAPPEPLPVPETPVGGQPLSANDAGANLISIGKDSIRITGPNTDVTFTGITDGGQFGNLTAREGIGIVNGERVKAVPQDGAAIIIGPGGFTGNRTVDATFDNGVTLDATIQNFLIDDPSPIFPQDKGLPLAPNSIGAERLIVGQSSVRLLGPGTDFTFTGITDRRPADGPLIATAGSGTINGVETTAVPLGNDNPFDPGASQVVFSLGSGFNVTGTQTVDAAFANGERLDTTVQRQA